MKITELSALNLSELIRQGELSCREAVSEFLSQEDVYNCFITRDAEYALKQADIVQRRIDSGERLSPLAGIPVAVKDNLSVKGMRATCASRMLENYVPVYDAECVSRLKRAGMIILGKTNMDEFAMGWSGETSAYGAVKNPHGTGCCAGGSSSGSAAAVAGKLAPLALGTDTGGSVRQPAAFCGVYGLKPTYGAVSRRGLIAYASSLDTVGVIGRDIPDTAALYSVIMGRDERDSTSVNSPDFKLSDIKSYDLKDKKIGVLVNTAEGGITDDIKKALRSTVKRISGLGGECSEIKLEFFDLAVSAYYVLACAEASSNLARYDGVRYGRRADGAKTLDELYVMSRSEGFGSEVKKRLMLGSFVLSAGYYDAYYLKALKAKRLISAEINRALESFDFILMPVTCDTAFRLGENKGDSLEMYLSDAFNVTANLAGVPALSIPCGKGENGMPIGLQLMAGRGKEAALLGAAFALNNE